MLLLGVANAQALRPVLRDPFNEGTDTRRGRRGLGQARGQFSAAAKVNKRRAAIRSSSLRAERTNPVNGSGSASSPAGLLATTIQVGFSRLNVPESSS